MVRQKIMGMLMSSLLVMYYFIHGALRIFPCYLCAWPSVKMFDFPDHFLPPICSIQRYGEAQVCFSSRRTQGPSLYHSQKFFDWKSSYCRIPHQSLCTSINASGQQLQSEPEAHDSASIWRAISASLDAFYRFSRPHTVIGTVNSSCCVVSFRSISTVQDLLVKLVCPWVGFSFSVHW